MTLQDSYLPLECTQETLDEGTAVDFAECSFCNKPSIPDLDYVYEKTGLHRHCIECYEEYSPYVLTPTRGLTRTFTEMLG